MINRRLQLLWVLSQSFREPYRTYWKLLHTLSHRTSMSHGTIKLGRWQVAYDDPHALGGMWNFQFFERYNDFYTTEQSPRILDCGSNIGVSVLRFKELYPHARIIAFEPDPAIAAILRHNVEANQLSDVEVVQAAVWTEDGEMSFASQGFGGTQSGYLLQEGDSSQLGATVSVPTVDLRDYLKEPVDFLKLDIEGAELEVLKVCAAELRNVRQMMVEVHYYIEQPEILIEILRILQEAGFRAAVYQYGKWPEHWLPYARKPYGEHDQYPVLWASRA